MKILIVNTSDSQGGAARAAYRLHKALLNEGVDSQMLVQKKTTADETVGGSSTKTGKGLTKIRQILDGLPTLFYPNKSKALFSPSWLPFSQVIKKINAIDSDVVHLHWICRGMIKIEDLAQIKKPIVWSMHDMWAFTGGCHYDENCGRYKNHCGCCKALGSTKQNDLSFSVFSRKHRYFKNLIIIGLSQWLTHAAKESFLFKNQRIINLPNPIDIHLFKPIEQKKARQFWNLPENKKLILFGAMDATSDLRKGYHKLMESLEKLQHKDGELVIFGGNEPVKKPKFKFNTHYIGQLHDDEHLAMLYSACDVMVVPSFQENLSNGIMEALSCGRPVVGFAIGGNGDMIDHHKNGYLAQPFDSNDLATGIDWILADEERYRQLCFAARNKVINNFAAEKVARQYIALYQSLISPP